MVMHFDQQAPFFVTVVSFRFSTAPFDKERTFAMVDYGYRGRGSALERWRLTFCGKDCSMLSSLRQSLTQYQR